MLKNADSIADSLADSIADSNADSYTDVKCQQKILEFNQISTFGHFLGVKLFYIIKMVKNADLIADFIAVLIADSNADSDINYRTSTENIETPPNQYFWAILGVM